MSFDALILNSGEWLLSREQPAAPWHMLVYTQRGSPSNELHVWLPRRDGRHPPRLAVKRFWIQGSTRWCVEIAGEAQGAGRARGARLRFSATDGRVVWAEGPGGRGLGDLSDEDLSRLLQSARPGPFLIPH